MTTASEIVKRALRLARVIGAGETPSADEMTDALEALNSMLEGWAIQKLYVYALQESPAYSLTTASIDVGPTGDIVVSPRPANVSDASYVRLAGTDYPLTLISEAEYDALASKGETGSIPEYMVWVNSVPDATLKFWPVAPVSLYLKTWRVLPAFVAGDDFVLPPGYNRAIVYSLAEEIAPEYGATVLPGVQMIARGARDAIKIRNVRVPKIRFDSALTGGGGYNVLTDS